MFRHPSTRLAASLCAVALTFGAVACSSDGDAASKKSIPSGGAPGTNDGGVLDPEGGRPFGVDRSSMAVALAAATSAADHSVDGSTIELIYDSGSREDPTARINCSVAVSMVGEDDRVVLSYPDGPLDCAVEMSEGAS